EVTVTPSFERIGGAFTPAFLGRPDVRPATRMGLNLIRRAPHDIDPSAVRFPARNPGSKVFVGVGDTPVILLFELVLRTAGVGISTLPELLDKLLPFLVGAQLLERRTFLVGDDVRHFFLEPFLIRALHFLLDSFLAAPLLFVCLLLVFVLAG